MRDVSYQIKEQQPNEESNKNDNIYYAPDIGLFRMYLPQILASTAKNLLLIDLGMAVAFPTIAIPALRGLVDNQGIHETLTLNAVQASWFGSIAFICQPVGSVLSGWVTEPLGRKKAMILVNIPHIIGWLTFYYLNSVSMIYFAAILMGLGVGFMEAPIVTYVGEISQPSIRGILTACAGVAASIGFFSVYLLGTLTTWRKAALICMTVPITAMIVICFVPETPFWLLSKKQPEKALESLQWLRGWVPPNAVEQEFKEMQRYSENSTKCKLCQKANIKCSHQKPTIKKMCGELLRRRTLKPFFILISYFAISQFCGWHSIRPYLVQIFQAYQLPIDASFGVVVVGLLGILSNIICMSLIKFTGKRIISLISIAGAGISCIGLGLYAHYNFQPQWSSFDKHLQVDMQTTSYIPITLFFILSFCTNFGISAIPWMLLSEVFPFKCRGVASGITAALNYILAFISTKTYFNLEGMLHLSGVMWLYGGVAFIGFFGLYFFLPETENRTLEEIETHFSKNLPISKVQIDTLAVNTGAMELTKNNPEPTHNATVLQQEIPKKDGCDNNAYDN